MAAKMIVGYTHPQLAGIREVFTEMVSLCRRTIPQLMSLESKYRTAPSLQLSDAEQKKMLTIPPQPGIGAALSVYCRGECVVNLVGGDMAEDKDWTEDALMPMLTASAGPQSLLLLHLCDYFRIPLNTRVVQLWSEFRGGGKELIEIRHLLTQTAGIPCISAPIGPAELLQPVILERMLLAESTAWTPGKAHGLHGITMGIIISRIVQLVSGLTAREYWRTFIAKPLLLDVHVDGFGPDKNLSGLGLKKKPVKDVANIPPTENSYGFKLSPVTFDHLEARAVKMQRPFLLRSVQDEIAQSSPRADNKEELAIANELFKRFRDPNSLASRTVHNPKAFSFPETSNMADFRGARLLSMNCFASAHGMARMYGALAYKGMLVIDDLEKAQSQLSAPILSESIMNQLTKAQVSGNDSVLGYSTAYTMGFALSALFRSFPTPQCYGNGGSGGTLAFADPERQLGVCFTSNCFLFSGSPGDPRWGLLLNPLYEEVKKLPN